MSNDHKNLESFRVIRGGQYARRDVTPQSKCRARVRERIVAILRAQQGTKDRALENLAAGVTNPMGEPLKLMRRLHRARQSFRQAWDVTIEPQIEALHDEYGREYVTGEFSPAA